MRYLLALLVAVLLGSCGKAAAPLNSSSPKSLGDFPTPAQLARLAPARAASGSDAQVNRLLQSEGAEYVAWPGYSSNAEVTGSNAVIHAVDDSLSYVMFQVGTPLVDNTDTLTQIRLDFEWATPPTDPEGLYIGLPDLDDDHWVWINGADANGSVFSIEDLEIHGADPATQPNGSFIAVVNFSSSDVTLSKIALRFRTPETVDSDEWLYFTEQPESAPAGISRISPEDNTVESVLPGETGADYAEYGVPHVANYSGTWKLDCAKSGMFQPQLWRADLDGSNAVAVRDDPGLSFNPAGHLDGSERSLIIAVSGGVRELLASDGGNQGRLSRASDAVLTATWDLSLDPSLEYGAIASTLVDNVNWYYGLMRFYGNGPFPINATPEAIYTRLPTESATEPEMFEYATLAGEPRFYIYFVARNRDDSTNNIYRLQYPGGEPEPVVVDAAYEFRYPCVSPDGRWLAYVRQPAGTLWYETGDLMLTSLLDPDSGSQQLSDRALYELSWYDPNP